MITYDDLEQKLKESTAVRLLRSQNTPLIAAFLYEQFKIAHKNTIPHTQLLERLEDYLDLINQGSTPRYPRTAKQYLDDWCNKHGYLRKYLPDHSDDPIYELTPDAERALNWIAELQTREFVGTESRFLYIFTLLEDLVEKSNENIPERLAYLKQEKERIEQEITKIEQTGEVQTYNETQIKEKLFELDNTATRLLSDFREIEGNFRQIVQTVRQKQLQADIRKGEIVGHVLEADDALKESDQGRSFYAFWQFLTSRQKQEAFQELLQQILTLDLVSNSPHNSHLRRLKRNLIDAGSKIVESNRRLAVQLRRLLDEQSVEEARRVHELIKQFKQTAAQLPPHSYGRHDTFTTVPGPSDIHLPLARPLWTPRPAVHFSHVTVEAADPELDDQTRNQLYNQFFVDSRALQNQIDRVLEKKGKTTLSEVVRYYPPQKGLAEILTYFNMATNSPHQTIVTDHLVTIPLTNTADNDNDTITVPQINYEKS